MRLAGWLWSLHQSKVQWRYFCKAWKASIDATTRNSQRCDLCQAEPSDIYASLSSKERHYANLMWCKGGNLYKTRLLESAKERASRTHPISRLSFSNFRISSICSRVDSSGYQSRFAFETCSSNSTRSKHPYIGNRKLLRWVWSYRRNAYLPMYSCSWSLLPHLKVTAQLRSAS